MEELFRRLEVVKVRDDPVDASHGENKRLLVMHLECGDQTFKAIEYAWLGDAFDDVGAQSTLRLKDNTKYSKAKVILLEPATCELVTLVKKEPPASPKKTDGPPPFRAFEETPAKSRPREASETVETIGPFRSLAKITGLEANGNHLNFSLADVEERRSLRSAVAADSLLSFLIPPQFSAEDVVDKLRPAFVEKIFVFDFTPIPSLSPGVYQIENINTPLSR